MESNRAQVPGYMSYCATASCRRLIKSFWISASKCVFCSLWGCESVCVCWHDLPCIQRAGTCRRSRAPPSDRPPPAPFHQTGRQLQQTQKHHQHTHKYTNTHKSKSLALKTHSPCTIFRAFNCICFNECGCKTRNEPWKSWVSFWICTFLRDSSGFYTTSL